MNRGQMQKTAWITILCMTMNFAFAENPRCLLPPDFGELKTKFKPFSLTQIYIPLWYKYTRFFYSVTNHKCIEFPYWGHGGNANNFKTMEECQTKCSNYPQIPPPELSVEGNCTSLSCDTDRSDLLPNCKIGKMPKYSSATCCPPVICTEKKDHSDTMCLYNIGANNQMVLQSGASIPVSYYPCFECKCNDRFQGIITTEGKVCMEINCGLSFSYFKQKLDAGCKPDYFYKNTNKYRKPSCCPTQWKCSITDSDLNQVGRSIIQINATTESTIIKYISSATRDIISPETNQTLTMGMGHHVGDANTNNNITDADNIHTSAAKI